MKHHPPIEQNWDKLHIAWFWGTPVQFLKHKRSPNLFVAVSDKVPDLFIQAHSIFGLDRKTQAHFERKQKDGPSSNPAGGEVFSGERRQA